MVIDEEVILDKILGIMQANFPAKIAEINAEKSDSIVLEDIPANAWLDSLNYKIANYNPFVYYGIVDQSANSIGPATGMQLNIVFEVAFVNDYNDSQIVRKVMRYARAFREITQESFKKVSGADIIKIANLVPVDLKASEESQTYKVGGVQIFVNIWN